MFLWRDQLINSSSSILMFLHLYFVDDIPLLDEDGRGARASPASEKMKSSECGEGGGGEGVN